MGEPSSDEDVASVTQIDAFLNTLRRSAEIAQELIRSGAQQAERIRSLEGDLASARLRQSFLETELTKIRNLLGEGGPDLAQLAMLEELVEDQNVLAQLFVTSDRLARVESVTDAVAVAVEIMHNLVGAHRYGVFVATERGPIVVAPAEARYRVKDGEQRELLTQTLAAPAVDKPAQLKVGTTPPLCVPLRLGKRVVGALLIAELVPQVGGTLGRLQHELLSLLAERLASSMCLGAFHQERIGRGEPWTAVASSLASITERP
jgi:hypothetical protein